MKTRSIVFAATVSVATLMAGRAEEPVRQTLVRSIPEEVMFCGRMQLSVAFKSQQAERILAAAEKQFREPLDAIGQFSGLRLDDVDCIWVGVVKDEEALIILEGSFDAESILNSGIVMNARKKVRPGTLVSCPANTLSTGYPLRSSG